MLAIDHLQCNAVLTVRKYHSQFRIISWVMENGILSNISTIQTLYSLTHMAVWTSRQIFSRNRHGFLVMQSTCMLNFLQQVAFTGTLGG